MTRRNINRRDFIKTVATTVAGVASFPYIVPSSVLGAQGQTPPNDRIVIGFIACGKQSKHLMRSFLNSPGTQVVAACDVDKLKLERGKGIVEGHYAQKGNTSYKGCAAYSDFREVLARDDIDAVVISTPDHWHSVTVIESAKAGKDIYCEKPLSQTIAEANAMIAAIRKYNRVFQTGSMQRSSWNFRFACELVQNGYIGDIQHVTVGVGGPPADRPLEPQPVPEYLDWDRWLGPVMWRPYHSELSPHLSWDGFPHWRNHSWFGGGGMTDWGAHHFDIAQWGLGMDGTEPAEIYPPDGKEHQVLTYVYHNGIPMTRDQANGILFEGSKGKVEVNRGYLKTWPESLKDQKIGPDEIHLYDSKNHYVDWLDAIRSRNKPICDIETGASSVKVCHLGNLAYKLQRPLKWDRRRNVFIADDEANRLLWRPMRSPWQI